MSIDPHVKEEIQRLAKVTKRKVRFNGQTVKILMTDKHGNDKISTEMRPLAALAYLRNVKHCGDAPSPIIRRKYQ